MSNLPQKNIRKLSFLSFNRNSEGNDSSNGGTQAGEVRLDDEMEKVFSMSGNVSEDRFDVSRLHDAPESAPAGTPRLGEKDYSLHRKKSYPHIHVPLKALHSRSMRRRLTSPQIATTQSVDSPNSNPESPVGEADDITSRLSVSDTYALSSTATAADYPDRDDDDDTGAFSSGSEAPISDPAVGSGCQSQPLLIDESPGSLGSPDRHVQFTIGGIPKIPEDETQTDANEEDETKKHRKNRYHHHGHSSRFRKYSLQEDPGWRKRSGSEQRVTGSNGSRRVSIQPEDATLQEVDIDDLDSHRSDEPRVVRRHKTSKRGSVVHISRRDGGEKLLQNVLLPHAFKKMYDHSPHAIFVQLDELMGVGDDREWKETARWIKYEEDVEEGSDRWGRPHVASLSFHSLLNLRRCLETGVVLLDLEERDLPGVAYRVSEQMVTDELIQETDKPQIMRALLLRHRHVNEHDRGFRFARRHNSSYASLQSLWADEAFGSQRNVGRCSICSAQGRSSICSAQNIRLNSPHLPHRNNLHNDEKRKTSFPLETIQKNGTSNCDAEGRLIVPAENHTIIDLKEETYTSSTEDLKKAQNDTILKRIPIGAEATTVLVGAVDFLEQPTIAFVRLAEGILMPSITEVNIPVRFLFILLGPITADLDYHEIGRSISTLMANHQFLKIAYKADDRKALLSAINEFLDDSIVLPPGDWEKQTLLPFDELKAKSDAIRKRKLKAIKEKGDTTDETAKSLLAADGGDGKKPPRDDPLRRTRRPFGGLINDLKRRFPYYKSDITEGCNAQCAAAALFMYFAALSGAITFGGLMSDKTQNMIGISETLVATSVAGIVFALVSGQPLVIVGSTGPLLLFDESLFEFCKSNNLEYLTTRIYIGIWMGVIALIVACFEGSVFVKLFTRFTEEIFSALISLLYIVESVMKLFFVFGRHPLMASYCDSFMAAGFAVTEAMFLNTTEQNETVYTDYDGMLMDEALSNGTDSDNTTPMSFMVFNKSEELSMEPEPYIGPINQPNTALFCSILSLGTFAIAYYLRLFRNSKFLGRNARRALGDFGVPIAIVLMVALDYFVPETYTEKLKVPEGLSPSNPQVRGWLINPAGTNSPFPLWLAFACVIPAMLVYILIFMETHISELIIDKKERKLRKGSGFHLDIVLICLINVGCGFLGTPWICAATVRSVAHVSAVTVMSRTHAPGEKPHVVEVKEQRVSALTVATLVGISVLMSPLLRLVPMSVLFGVFLYMGISSMDGIQFFDRIKLFFMPVKHHPSVPYVRRVQTFKMHLFTFIQLMCLVVLWVVKSTKASLAFPFFLLLMVPVRAQMTHLFTPAELRALDGDQPDADGDEPDFYVEATLPG